MLSDIDNLALDMSRGNIYIFLHKKWSNSIPGLGTSIIFSRPDLSVLQGLFDILPLTSNQKEARSALWSVIMQLLVQIKESEMDKPKLHQYATVLASKFELIEEDLLDHQVIMSDERGSSTESKSNATVVAVS